MATEGEERFLRLSYLLLKGTFFVVKKVLIREAENVHQQTGCDLDGLLKGYEQRLKHQFRNKKQLEILFPPSGKTNVEDWDISLLTVVLLIVFRQSLSNVDRTAITNIQYQRNNVYAHCKVASLDEVDYTDTCNNLEDAFNILASRCGDEVKQECDAIIQTCLNGALERKSHVELLKQLAEKDNMLVEIIAKIEPIELREKVLKALEQALQGQRRVEVKVVDSHLGICGTDEDQDNIALAENIIVTVTNEAIRRAQTCKEYTRIREIIQEILDEITSQTGVKPISAEKSCVIIRFGCCSNEQLFKFIIYMESKDMKERLNKLADSLSRLLNTKETLQVSFSLTLETLKSILDKITPTVQREYKRSVHIPIQIESVEGIKRVFDLFEGGGLTTNLQKLSEALTEKVGAQINVKPSINMKQLKEALEDFDTDPEEDPARQIGKPKECRSEEGATGELYVDAEEGGDESTQINLTDHEEDIYVEKEEPEEQSIQENPSVHKGELYVDAEEGLEESTQIKLTDHEEDIKKEREEPEEQSIQEQPSDETSIQKDDAKDESSEENETDHEEEIYVDAKEPEEQNIQKKTTDHEEEIYVDAKEPEEQNIQKKTTVVTLSSRVQYRESLFRLQSLVIDVGTDILRNIFDQKLQGVALDAFLANEMENLENLKQQGAITDAQFNLLYLPGGQPSNIAEFDITLILCLLRHLPSLRSSEVAAYIEPDLCRLCKIMDKIVRTSWTGRFEQSFFDTIKTDIEEVLMGLNATVPKPLANLSEKIKRYDNKTLDPSTHRRNQTIFNQWWEMEYEYVIPQRSLRTKIPKKRQDFGDINPQVTKQKVKRMYRIGGFRSVLEEKQHTKQDVTSMKKYYKSLEANVKPIKTEDIEFMEQRASKENEAESIYRQTKSMVKISSRGYRESLFRLQSLVIDVGTDVLRNIFYQRLQDVALDAFLANEMEDIKNLEQQGAITDAQYNLLFPPGGQPSNIAEFDITLILCLLRHLPSLRSNEFYRSVVSIEPDIRRLCHIITEIVRLTRRFKRLNFNTIKTDIEQVLLRLNAKVPKPLANLHERIKRCENKTLDPAAEQKNQDIFHQWELMQFAPVIHRRPIRRIFSPNLGYFGDINPQVTIQNVKKVDSIRGFRSELEQKQYVKQDVTPMKKDFKSIETDLKSIKTNGEGGENRYCYII